MPWVASPVVLWKEERKRPPSFSLALPCALPLRFLCRSPLPLARVCLFCAIFHDWQKNCTRANNKFCLGHECYSEGPCGPISIMFSLATNAFSLWLPYGCRRLALFISENTSLSTPCPVVHVRVVVNTKKKKRCPCLFEFSQTSAQSPHLLCLFLPLPLFLFPVTSWSLCVDIVFKH